jgi:hypothetical protein
MGRLLALGHDDIEAELIGALWRKIPVFDERRASMRTFASRVMDSYALSMARHAHAQRRYAGAVMGSLDDSMTGAGGNSVPIGTTLSDPRADSVALRARDVAIDVHRILQTLPMETRHVALALSDGSVSQASEELKKSRTHVYREIARLRQAFASAGLAPTGRNNRSRQLETASEVPSVA